MGDPSGYNDPCIVYLPYQHIVKGPHLPAFEELHGAHFSLHVHAGGDDPLPYQQFAAQSDVFQTERDGIAFLVLPLSQPADVLISE